MSGALRRTLRTAAAAMAIVMLLTATTASGVAAKGRPMRASITQASCGRLIVETSRWNKVTVRSVYVSYAVNGENQGSFGLGDANGLVSPTSLPVSGSAVLVPHDHLLGRRAPMPTRGSRGHSSSTRPRRRSRSPASWGSHCSAEGARIPPGSPSSARTNEPLPGDLEGLSLVGAYPRSIKRR